MDLVVGHRVGRGDSSNMIIAPTRHAVVLEASALKPVRTSELVGGRGEWVMGWIG